MKSISYRNSILTSLLITTTSSFILNSQNKRPNILFVIADDASYNHFSSNGSKWVNTPAFDRIATQGIRFTNCYTSNAKSSPSRACVLTGQYFWQLEAAANHNPFFPPNINVFTDALKNNGYNIAYTGKGWAPGIALTSKGTKRLLTGDPYLTKTLIPPTCGISNIDYISNFKDFLDMNNDGKPWFFWFGSFEPHRPYEYGSGMRLTKKLPSNINDFPKIWPDNDIVRNDMLDYAFELEYFDKQLLAFLQELEIRKMLDNTIVVVTSDNGMPFPRVKGNNYDCSHHMPLAIMWKDGIKIKGRTIHDYVNLIDIAPTFLEITRTNAKKNGMQPAGHSLSEYFVPQKSTKKSYRTFTLVGRERHDYGRPACQGYPIRGIIYNNYLYIQNIKPDLFPCGNPETGYTDCDGSPTKSEILNLNRTKANTWYYDLTFGIRPSEELYDLKNDPECIKNLIHSDMYSKLRKILKFKLIKNLKINKDPRFSSSKIVFDNYPYSEQIGFDFWEKVVSGKLKEPWRKTGWINASDYEQ